MKYNTLTTYEIVICLCATDYSLWLNGDINRHELSRRTGVPVVTISRFLSGGICRFRKNNLQKIANYFEVSIAQIMGIESIKRLHEEPLFYVRCFNNLKKNIDEKLQSILDLEATVQVISAKITLLVAQNNEPK